LLMTTVAVEAVMPTGCASDGLHAAEVGVVAGTK
jgi:hypothetical protein